MLKLKIIWLLVLLGVPVPLNDTLDAVAAAAYTTQKCEYDGLSKVVGIQVAVPDTSDIKCLEAIQKVEHYVHEQNENTSHCRE